MDRDADFINCQDKNNYNESNSLSPMPDHHNTLKDTDSNLMSGKTLKSYGGSQQTLNTTHVKKDLQVF